jgi:hypothetical protein
MAGIQSLGPRSNVFLQFDAVRAFAVLYECNLEDFKHELHQARRLLERKKETTNHHESPASLLEFACLQEPYKDALHELYRLCQIAVTLPVSSAACERSFSALKRIKTYLLELGTGLHFSARPGPARPVPMFGPARPVWISQISGPAWPGPLNFKPARPGPFGFHTGPVRSRGRE